MTSACAPRNASRDLIKHEFEHEGGHARWTALRLAASSCCAARADGRKSGIWNQTHMEKFPQMKHQARIGVEELRLMLEPEAVLKLAANLCGRCSRFGSWVHPGLRLGLGLSVKYKQLSV